MQLTSRSQPLRRAACLSLASAALLCLSVGAQAQSKLSYQVINDTLSGGGADFPVTDDVTFTHLSLTEQFADQYTTMVPLMDLNGAPQTTLDTGVIELDSALFTYPNSTHGTLQSAVLTGQLNISGLLPNPDGTITLTLQPTLDPASQQTQNVLPDFTAVLFGSAPPPDGIGVGQFSAVDNANTVVATTRIIAGSRAAVPEPGIYAILAAAALALLPFLRSRLRRAA